jgi:hypothetical protein
MTWFCSRVYPIMNSCTNIALLELDDTSLTAACLVWDHAESSIRKSSFHSLGTDIPALFNAWIQTTKTLLCTI